MLSAHSSVSGATSPPERVLWETQPCALLLLVNEESKETGQILAEA